MLPSREVDHPQNAGMRRTSEDGELAEVLVKRHEDAPFMTRPLQYFSTAWIMVTIAGSRGIVTSFLQRDADATRDAGIKQHSHVLLSRSSGSTRSFPTTLRAYTRQARISSGSNHGYDSRIISGVSPAASIQRACSTASRRPRTIVFCRQRWSGLNVMRCKRAYSSIRRVLRLPATQRLCCSRVAVSVASGTPTGARTGYSEGRTEGWCGRRAGGGRRT